MSWSTPLVTATAGSSDGTAVPLTSGIDTTGADFLVIVLTSFGTVTGTVTDSKSNTWTLAADYDVANHPGTQIWYSVPTSVGTAHTFSHDTTGAYKAIAMAAFSGGNAAPGDQQNGITWQTTTSAAAGSITPSVDNCLVIAGLSEDGAITTLAIDESYTISADIAGVGSASVRASLAYKIQTTATATNPTWSWVNSVQNNCAIASFKAAAGGLAIPIASYYHQHLHG